MKGNPGTQEVQEFWGFSVTTAFIFVLSFSRHMFLRLVRRIDQENWLGCHVAAFDFLGGVPQRSIEPVTLAQVRVTLCFLTGLAVAGLVRPRLLRINKVDLPFLALYGVCGITATQLTYYLAIHTPSSPRSTRSSSSGGDRGLLGARLGVGPGVLHPHRAGGRRADGPLDPPFFLYLAVFTTFVPFGPYLTGLRHIEATSAVVASTLEPVWATVLAGLFLGEGLTLTQVAGCLSILVAIVSLQALPGAAIVDRVPSEADPA